MRVLLVEDDRRIAADVKAALEAAGYLVEMSRDGEDAWFKGDTEDYGAIVLDLGLPGMDGLSVLKRWRANGRQMPVLILTARGSWAERVDGIDAGADDYLPKPFRMEELLARLRSIVRRSAGHASPVISVGDVTLDERQMKISLRGVPISLSPLEYRLAAYLLLRRGRVVSQQELSENIYGHDDAHDSNAIEVLVGRVRRKLGTGFITTRRGYGYLVPEAIP
jgi:DNA-binding response OmpR family regulator